MSQAPIFGFTINPVDVAGTHDDQLYAGAVADAKFGYALGYDVVYSVEHHFSDYFPIPNPLMLFMRIAPECPGLGFGTMVLVTPWHQPLRLAEDIAMLSVLSSGPLHLGLGRGNSPLEYDAFGVDMEQTVDHFEDAWRIIDLALNGEAFTYQGKVLSVANAVRIRPDPHRERIHFYGAIGNPDSAERIAQLGLAPMSNGFLPLTDQKGIMAAWDQKTLEIGGNTDVGRPIVVSLIMADTDAEAYNLGREYLPKFFRAATAHYEIALDPYKNIKGYEAFSKLFANLQSLSDPANLGPYMDVSLVGSPETVREKVEAYLDCGFNNFMLMPSSPGIPQHLRHQWLQRFASDVLPHFRGNATSN